MRIETSFRGDTFVDVGANAGLFSKLVRSHIGTHGKIHSFEANPISVASLRKNLEGIWKCSDT